MDGDLLCAHEFKADFDDACRQLGVPVFTILEGGYSRDLPDLVLAYLKGVDDNDNCAWAKSYSWTENFTIACLQETLEKYFTEKEIAQPGAFGNIRDIEFTLDKEIGRIKTMQVYTNFGVFKETSDHIRWALGRPSVPGAILPSTRFKAEKQMSGNALVGLKITGTGNGHGVGMCQCGAIGQSRVGQKCDDILKFYYKHIKIERIY